MNREKDTRPVFYWFCDIWHSNLPDFRSKYFYLFVKNPKDDNIKLRARHEGLDFHGLYTWYEKYLKKRNEKKFNMLFHSSKGNWGNYCEPSILMSFSNTEPDFVLHFEKEHNRFGLMVKPKEYQGTKIYLFNKNFYPIKFTDIPEIIGIIPKIKMSYPFLTPKLVNGKYIYEDWNLMVTEKMGSWL